MIPLALFTALSPKIKYGVIWFLQNIHRLTYIATGIIDAHTNSLWIPMLYVFFFGMPPKHSFSRNFVINFHNRQCMKTTALGYEEAFYIRTYEIDNQKKATIPALVRLMQEAAMQNVMKLKLSIWDMEEHHISWVLLRKDMRINRLPNLGETINVTTQPTGFEKFFAYRDFRIFDRQGELLLYSSSTWLLMDTQSRKMARIPEFILEYASQMPPAEQCLPRPDNKFPPFEKIDFVDDFRVSWHHLDFNQHLNNTQYIAWMLDTIPFDLLQTGDLQQFEIQYRHECKHEDLLLAQTQQLSDHSFLHRLIHQHNQQEVALARSTWK